MTQTEYLIEDIEKFLQINNSYEAEEENASLKKLLSVQNKIPIFKDIDPIDLKSIVYDIKFVRAKFKDYIVEENDMSEEIFFIITGECQVFHKNKSVGKLKHGDAFGEAGAIFKTKRNATVVCSSKEATLLSFRIDENNMEFCSVALATLYKNLAEQINAKLEGSNISLIKM